MRETPVATPERIVSLVPSLTEACFAVGLGGRVVGVTDWCVHPAGGVERLPKLGGTKDPDIDAIAALAPDLVIANREENTRRAVEALEARGLRVWVTYPRTVADGVALLRALASLSPDAARADAVAAEVEAVFETAPGRTSVASVRVFCPIWRDPWMAVGADTYASDLLRLCGGENVFAERRDRRYPIVELPDIVRAAPDVVLLPNEPYAFGPRDVAELSELDIPAARDGRIHPIDGTWVSWYGPRIADAIAGLSPLLATPPDPPM
jgi:ABC-type Fe3+-hydroxamate transport system substrate-binding protein